jgi:hypothetical protein
MRIASLVASLPVVRLVVGLRQRRDRLGLVLVGMIAGYAALTLALALSPQVAHAMLARFHLRTPSFVGWALTAPQPWMYNFDNRFLVADRPLTAAELAAPPRPLRWEQANHQPARSFSFADGRSRFLARAGEHYFYLDSRYRDARVTTLYVVRTPAANGAASEVRRQPP